MCYLAIIKDQAIISNDTARLYFCNNECKGIDKDEFKKDLTELLNQLIIQNPTVRYYQGLHDIGAALLLVLEPPIAFKALEVICKYHI